MSETRLGDIVDDYCPRCRLLTNHSVVAMQDGAIRKVRCRTCHNDHDYRHARVAARKQKPSAFEEVLARLNPPTLEPAAPKPKRARKGRST